jgi:2-dehydro-3-deoxyphosphooctonate aldolase (KDO 8-P synthase)
MHTISVANVTIGPDRPLTIIAGPCLAESFELCRQVGGVLSRRCAELGLGYIFKASFDKANRSSMASARGPGLDLAMDWFAKLKLELNVPITTDIHEPQQAAAVAPVVDLLQIPAFLCRQTDLLAAAAATGKAVNAKKGQFMAPAEMANVVGKLSDASLNGSPQIMLTERGTFFGYGRLVNDFTGLADLAALSWPVCFDATHSTQQPGGADAGKSTGGRPEHVPLLARCAVAAGVQALFFEAHPHPEQALCDGPAMLQLDALVELLGELAHLHAAVQHRPG